jgi:hypothetical protein
MSLSLGETVITTRRLDELRRKERAHDAYLVAMTRMRHRRVDGDDSFRAGWNACLRTFAMDVIDAHEDVAA